MNNLLMWVGRLAGCLGVVLAGLSMVARAMGMWKIAALPVGTLLIGGIAVMVIATLAYVAALAERTTR